MKKTLMSASRLPGVEAGARTHHADLVSKGSDRPSRFAKHVPR